MPASGDVETALASSERVAEATDIYAALLKDDPAALNAQHHLIWKAVKAAKNSNTHVDHEQLLLTLPNTGIKLRELRKAVKAARLRIRKARTVKERRQGNTQVEGESGGVK